PREQMVRSTLAMTPATCSGLSTVADAMQQTARNHSQQQGFERKKGQVRPALLQHWKLQELQFKVNLCTHVREEGKCFTAVSCARERNGADTNVQVVDDLKRYREVCKQQVPDERTGPGNTKGAEEQTARRNLNLHTFQVNSGI